MRACARSPTHRELLTAVAKQTKRNETNKKQVTFFLTYIWVVGLYVYSLVLNKRRIGFRALKAHLSDCALDQHSAAAAAAAAGGAAGGGGAGGVGGAAGAGTAGAAAGAADGGKVPRKTSGDSHGKDNGGNGNGGGNGGGAAGGEGRPLLPVRSDGGGKLLGGGAADGAASGAAAASPFSGNGSTEGGGGGGGNGGGGSGSPRPPPSASSFARELADAPLSRLVLRGDARVVADAEPVLRDCVEFGALLLWLFLCDRTSLFPGAEKTYSRDVFLFVFGTLVAVAGAASLSAPGRAPLLLNRPQTEEWKGWMQVLFLLYHYFEAREYYNAIRIFIAGYVWMTGFGNFSYYYKTGDFGVGRFAQMMWRLNFLVFFCCLVLNNSYMLYYICPMHTIFTVLVYGCLAAAPALNKVDAAVWAKIALSFAFVFVFWDLKPVFYAVWRPFGRLVTYVDPRKPRDKQDPMHGESFCFNPPTPLFFCFSSCCRRSRGVSPRSEKIKTQNPKNQTKTQKQRQNDHVSSTEWFFRSSLDRYVWIYGMICAFSHPAASRLLSRLDDPAKARGRRWLERALAIGATLACAGVYYRTVYVLPKLEYNRVHPYTSWIPLTIWMVFRNITPALRLRSLRLFGWLGTITLETYLCQFHVWLRSEVSDGQPKLLLALVPGYPLVNFAATSALYIFVSHRFFELTNSFKDVAVPHDDNRRLLRNGVLLAASLGASLAVGGAVRGALALALGV